MSLSDSTPRPRWYVLNHIAPAAAGAASKAVDRFNASAPAALELFAPTYVVREVRDGETRFRTAALTFHYVFVRGTLPEVKALCAQPNGFSFLIDRAAADRYATVSDSTMAAFRTIAHAYNNRLPYFSLADIELEAGDLVEVIHGDFPGLTGTYIPTPKSRSGNVVLTIYNNVGTVAFNVKASDVRVLRFSPLTTRANDQLDAFLPVLLSALRHHAASGPLPRTLAAKLAVFTGRMAAVKMDTRKLDARLRMLLYGAHTLLGDTAEASAALARYDRVKDAVTNPWTRAAHRLILAVLTGSQKSELQLMKEESPPPASKLQRLILAEYTHYLEETLP